MTFRVPISHYFLCNYRLTLHNVEFKTFRTRWIGWALFGVNSGPLQEIKAIMGCGWIFDTGPFFCETTVFARFHQNDYIAVVCSNNQAVTHSRIRILLISRCLSRYCLGLELLRKIQIGLPVIYTCVIRDGKWAWQPKNFWVHFTRQWVNPLFNF